MEERLRKVSGREREMTRPCGEQITPCHAHGVGCEGFHDGRRDDDAGEDERRDSSALPSGDSEVAEDGRRTSTNATSRYMLIFAILVACQLVATMVRSRRRRHGRRQLVVTQ